MIRLGINDELQERLIRAISRRDRIPLDQAERIFASLPVAELIRLELETPRPSFTAEYDTFGR